MQARFILAGFFLILFLIGSVFSVVQTSEASTSDVSAAISATKSAPPVPTLKVKETELVRLRVEGRDLDKDDVFYRYSLPLNDRGEWQTDYGDAGEYNLKVTASDGSAETVQYIKLIVEKKNRLPQLIQKKITVREGDIVDLKSTVYDRDKDILTFSFDEPFNDDGKWRTGDDDQGTYRMEFSVSDNAGGAAGGGGSAGSSNSVGNSSSGNSKNGVIDNNFLIFNVEVEVLNVNQPPKIVRTFSSDSEKHYSEDQTGSFFAEVHDADGDLLRFRWMLDNETISSEANVSYYFNYGSAGRHNLTLLTSDEHFSGEISGERNSEEIIGSIKANTTAALITKTWRLVVAKKNRKPEFEHLPVIVNEGETVKMDLPERDIDGDKIIYAYGASLTSSGEWATGFNDSGKYKFKIEATDGQLNTSGWVEVTVLDVDRKPTLIVPEEGIIFEGQKWNFTPAASDPDGDKISLTVEAADGLPAGMNLSNGTIFWHPNYDTLRRKGGIISNVLNRLRLEHFFLKERTYPLTIKACGKKECTSAVMQIHLRNVNRPPVFTSVLNTTILETEEIRLNVSAIDPDGDVVHYYFTEPLSKRKPVWQTEKGDKGEYTTYVTATDGDEQTTKPILLKVKKKNTFPELLVEDAVKVKEGQEFTLRLSGKDEDNDNLALKLRNLPAGATFKEGIFVWQPGFNSVVNKTDSWWEDLVSVVPYLSGKLSSEKSAVMLEFAVSDGEAEVVHPVKVNIVNVNRPPQIVDYLPQKEITVWAGEPVVFHVTGKDADGDALTYSWSFSFHEPQVKRTDTIERTFVAPGKKKVEIVVSDGRNSVSQEWIVTVLGKEQKQRVDVKQKEPFTVQVYELEFKK